MSKIHVEKTIYFVRHGESEDNTKQVFQSTSSSLSERGRGQASKIADRALRLNFQALVSSTHTRAKETAEIIASVTNKEIEYSDLFVERIKPTILNGKFRDDPLYDELSKKWHKSLFKKDLRVEDGENYEDIVARADNVLEFLKKRPEKDLLVVTHGFFMRVIIARVILGSSMTEENLRHFQSMASMKNTGLSSIQYSKWDGEDEPKWRLWIYNDHSHLG